ncbi:MAG TPA: phosphate ABC transporter substrate-binding protein [Thermoanaerobaculia bacterium]|nr:phosphate ABC transporter substrate-binding protein [Thermoanaerobaculia bacterium]
MKSSIWTALSFLFFAVACAPAERTSVDRSSGSSAQSAQVASGKPISIKGSDTMVILGQRFAEEYMKANPGTVIQVNGGGSGTGIAALINGTVDLAQSSRPMKPKEKADVETNRKATLVEQPVALDALSVFVHGNNKVKTLSLPQLKEIYTGKATNWKQVGGSDAQIIMYGRENSSGTYEYFKEHVLEKADFAARVQTLQGTAAVINAVAKDPNGIGYGGIAYSKDVTLVSVKNDASSAAIAPNETTVLDGSYPISRKLFFYYLSTASEAQKNFVTWVLSPAGQAVIKDVGYFQLAGGSAERSAAATTNTASPSNP